MTNDTHGLVASIANRTSQFATDNLEYVRRILHSIIVAALAVDIYGWPRDHDDSSRQEPAREICWFNHEVGWATVALTGNEAEDVEAYLVCGGDATKWPYSYGARALRGTRRRMGEPIPRVRLDRAQLELVVLAHHLMSPTTTKPDQRERALAQAQALLAADRPSALYLVAERMFKGTWAQKLQQLNWLLDGKESSLVICRYCYHAIDEFDPYLTTDKEDEDDRSRRNYDRLPRFSAHAFCYYCP